MSDDSIPRSILIVCLILSGGFFAGCETAFSYCNKIRMRMLADDGNRFAKRVVTIVEDFDRTIVTLLIAINVIYITASSIATVMAVRLLGNAGSVLSTVLMTLSVFLFAETIPKNIARVNSDAYALIAAYPIVLFRTIFKPVAMLFTWLGERVKSLMPKHEEEPTVTEDEFTEMVEGIAEDGLIEPEETEIIKSAIEFSEIMADSVMTPVEKVVGVPLRATPEEVKRILIEEKFSRFPVYDGTMDKIIGVMQASSVLYKLMKGHPLDLRDNLTRPYVIRPDMPVSKVFKGMGGRHTHFAVVADQGVTLGIITMEDILEEIVGEIYDEDDDVTIEEARAQ